MTRLTSSLTSSPHSGGDPRKPSTRDVKKTLNAVRYRIVSIISIVSTIISHCASVRLSVSLSHHSAPLRSAVGRRQGLGRKRQGLEPVQQRRVECEEEGARHVEGLNVDQSVHLSNLLERRPILLEPSQRGRVATRDAPSPRVTNGQTGRPSVPHNS